jgi:hypothetical protein
VSTANRRAAAQLEQVDLDLDPGRLARTQTEAS